MTSIVIVMDENRRLRGLSPEDERAYNRWRKLVGNLEVGETLEFDFTIPRSPKHHRAFMRKVRILLERTEAITDFTALRKWLTIGAGYTEPDGAGGHQAQSLNFGQMDEVDFAEFHHKVDEFLWSQHAGDFLWPHLTDKARHDILDSFFYAVEQRGQA